MKCVVLCEMFGSLAAVDDGSNVHLVLVLSKHTNISASHEQHRQMTMYEGGKGKVVRQGFSQLTWLSMEIVAVSSISVALYQSVSLWVFAINLAVQSDMANSSHTLLMEKSICLVISVHILSLATYQLLHLV